MVTGRRGLLATGRRKVSVAAYTGYQGLCWMDSDDVWWYLMAEGVSCEEPELRHVIEPNDNTVRR